MYVFVLGMTLTIDKELAEDYQGSSPSRTCKMSIDNSSTNSPFPVSPPSWNLTQLDSGVTRTITNYTSTVVANTGSETTVRFPLTEDINGDVLTCWFTFHNLLIRLNHTINITGKSSNTGDFPVTVYKIQVILRHRQVQIQN